MARLIGAEDIENYLTTYGWVYQRPAPALPEWRVSFGGDRRKFDLRIDLDGTFLTLKIPIVSECTPQDVHNWELHALNQELRLARVDTDGHSVWLRCELQRNGCQYEQFSQALGILAYYADAVSQELDLVCDQEKLDSILPS